MKVCIVGAGQIAEAHIEEIQKIKGAEVVALCDLRRTPTWALAEKYNIKSTYTALEEMLENEELDVVHITTPPGSHFFIAQKSLEANCHVYIEKPLTLTAQETKELLVLAQQKDLMVCPGTHRLRSHETLSTFDIVNNKEHFGEMVHIDAVFGYNLEGPFGKMVISNPDHWIAKLPGQIFQNNISHPIAMIAPYLSDDLDISAIAFDKSNNGIINDELRVQIFDKKNKITASVNFISGARPVQFLVRYFGSQSTVNLNLTEHFLLEDKSQSLPGGLGLSLNVRTKAKSLAKQFRTNFMAFWTGKETFFSDMRRLIDDFYQAIETKGKPPVPYDELQRTSDIIDAINAQITAPGDK
ncbi:Gfo/Idh/MocA family oxidoreductase [Thalassotalea sp. LPB0316]|uniref:Gfo/Idh/MocA family protein n=1 Tax=Thalassotalea sp. LPB0316 TaxID=2769490 RepID=UPI0018683481|nr:Gfo/Idh/MocA family oxidoreductase [Thalassotalea sp. LPB0316]QOL26493.1 Gfo/Idh/MocA family oxidoreductase [Thalassotalea sp. LPB0316]